MLAVVLAGPLIAQQQRPQILSRLTWFDRAGTRLGGIGPVADHGNIELSPDGTRVAVAVTDHAHETRDIWIYDATSGDRTRFTSDPADENWLIWSSDSQRVVLNSFGREHLDLFEAGAQSLAPRAVLMQDAIAKWPVSWSPDGRFVLYVTNSRTTSNDIWVLPLTGDRKAFPFLRTDASENWAAFSPDGKWVAFSSTDTGTIEVYVSPFPSNGKRFRVSADGGSQARWRRDGSEIFYLAPDRTIVAVEPAEALYAARGVERRAGKRSQPGQVLVATGLEGLARVVVPRRKGQLRRQRLGGVGEAVEAIGGHGHESAEQRIGGQDHVALSRALAREPRETGEQQQRAQEHVAVDAE